MQNYVSFENSNIAGNTSIILVLLGRVTTTNIESESEFVFLFVRLSRLTYTIGCHRTAYMYVVRGKYIERDIG